MTDKRYSVPAGIVHGLVVTVLGSTILSSGSMIWMAFEFRAGLEKLDRMPSPDLINSAMSKLNSMPSGQLLDERRETIRERNKAQDRRLDRLERSFYGQSSENVLDESWQQNPPPVPGPPAPSTDETRLAILPKRQNST